MAKRKMKLHYEGSVPWLIFWVIVFFPAALVLLFTASTIRIHETIYRFRYHGSRGWLVAWTIIFFPIAIILILLKGFTTEKRILKSKK